MPARQGGSGAGESFLDDVVSRRPRGDVESVEDGDAAGEERAERARRACHGCFADQVAHAG